MDTLESKLLVRKKPKMFKIENSSALSRVKAFMPEIKKAEVDLWQQMKIGGDESVNVENVQEGEKGLDMEFGIVPSELIASSEDESDTDSEMDEDEKRIFDLINLKLSGAADSPKDSGFGSQIGEEESTTRPMIETIDEQMRDEKMQEFRKGF